jgi:hypothetical protein
VHVNRVLQHLRKIKRLKALGSFNPNYLHLPDGTGSARQGF